MKNSVRYIKRRAQRKTPSKESSFSDAEDIQCNHSKIDKTLMKYQKKKKDKGLNEKRQEKICLNSNQFTKKKKTNKNKSIIKIEKEQEHKNLNIYITNSPKTSLNPENISKFEEKTKNVLFLKNNNKSYKKMNYTIKKIYMYILLSLFCNILSQIDLRKNEMYKIIIHYSQEITLKVKGPGIKNILTTSSSYNIYNCPHNIYLNNELITNRATDCFI